jgi:hypothetical protein
MNVLKNYKYYVSISLKEFMFTQYMQFAITPTMLKVSIAKQ